MIPRNTAATVFILSRGDIHTSLPYVRNGGHNIATTPLNRTWSRGECEMGCNLLQLNQFNILSFYFNY